MIGNGNDPVSANLVIPTTAVPGTYNIQVLVYDLSTNVIKNSRATFFAAKNNIGAFSPTPSGAWYSAILNDIGKLYINRAGTTQFKIYFTTGDNDDLGADVIRFYSGNAGPASRPKLVIQYYVP